MEAELGLFALLMMGAAGVSAFMGGDDVAEAEPTPLESDPSEDDTQIIVAEGDIPEADTGVPIAIATAPSTGDEQPLNVSDASTGNNLFTDDFFVLEEDPLSGQGSVAETDDGLPTTPRDFPFFSHDVYTQFGFIRPENNDLSLGRDSESLFPTSDLLDQPWAGSNFIMGVADSHNSLNGGEPEAASNRETAATIVNYLDLDTGEYLAVGGNDTLVGGGLHDWLRGMLGNDVLHGLDGSDRLNGGGGDDVLFGGLGDDEVHGAGGNDRIMLGLGDDINFYSPLYKVLFSAGSTDAFHRIMDLDRDRELVQPSEIIGNVVVNGVEESVTEFGDPSLAHARLVGDNYGDDTIRGGVRVEGMPPGWVDGNDTIVDPYGRDVIWGDLGDDVLMAFDREMFFTPETEGGLIPHDDPNFVDIRPDSLYGGYGDDTIFMDNGDYVVLDPIDEPDHNYQNTVFFGAEFSEYDPDKVANQEPGIVADFVPSNDTLVIMNFVQDSGLRTYDGDINILQQGVDSLVRMGDQVLVTLEGVNASDLVLGGNVVVDFDKSITDSMFAQFAAPS